MQSGFGQNLGSLVQNAQDLRFGTGLQLMAIANGQRKSDDVGVHIRRHQG
jgi:hypothetical protein